MIPEGGLIGQAIPRCHPCSIALTHVVTLGASDTVKRDLEHAQVVRDSRGYYYVGPVNRGTEVHVFDAAGSAVRVIRGSYQQPLDVYRVAVAVADTLLVAGVDGQVQLFDTTGRMVRRFQTSFRAHGIWALPSGEYVVTGAIATPEAVGYPLHILDSRGTIKLSFGSSQQQAAMIDNFVSGLRWVSIVNDGTIWAAWPNRYLIEHWDASGKLLSRVERTVEWFEPWLNDPRQIDYERPRPYQGAPMLSHGVLWTIVGVADSTWHAERTSPSDESAPGFTQADIDRLLDTMIEALDPSTGHVLASQRVREGTIGFLGHDLMFRRRVSNGKMIIDISRLSLSPSPRTRR